MSNFNWSDERLAKGVCCRIKIRHDLSRPVKEEAEKLDDTIAVLVPLWQMNEKDPYPGEWALGDHEEHNSLATAKLGWIASGDVEVLYTAMAWESTVDAWVKHSRY
jgi:hypothetical protein